MGSPGYREYGVAIIGAGHVGRKRAAAINGADGSRLAAVYDSDVQRAVAL